MARPGAGSSVARARGTIFLVDAKSKLVVWSAFEPASDNRAKQMDRVATQLVTRIKRELNPDKKK